MEEYFLKEVMDKIDGVRLSLVTQTVLLIFISVTLVFKKKVDQWLQ